jgi:hypothetical protein
VVLWVGVREFGFFRCVWGVCKGVACGVGEVLLDLYS